MAIRRTRDGCDAECLYHRVIVHRVPGPILSLAPTEAIRLHAFHTDRINLISASVLLIILANRAGICALTNPAFTTPG